MKHIAPAIWIAVIVSILGLGCGSSTGKNLYKDKDKPKPAAVILAPPPGKPLSKKYWKAPKHLSKVDCQSSSWNELDRWAEEVLRGGQRLPSQHQFSVQGPEVRTRAPLLDGKAETLIVHLNSHPDRFVSMCLEKPLDRPVQFSSDTQDA